METDPSILVTEILHLQRQLIEARRIPEQIAAWLEQRNLNHPFGVSEGRRILDLLAADIRRGDWRPTDD